MDVGIPVRKVMLNLKIGSDKTQNNNGYLYTNPKMILK